MKEKKQIALRIPYSLWESLNKMAEDEYRSLNGQIEYILVSAVRNRKTQRDIIKEEIIDNCIENDVNFPLINNKLKG